ncbi:MAG: hypothetical protein L3J71_01235 [Victivallaceae bacterium]|nr:hypothetical protein [Victivallaceae bacterium]
MSRKNSKTVENPPADEPLLFDPADATQFRNDLFDDSTVSDPEIDLLTVKAINRSTRKPGSSAETDETELEIEHGMMILNSHRKELAELEELAEGKVSNKKIAVVMIILLFFITFIVIMFVVSKLIDKYSPNNNSSAKISYNNG